MNRIMIVDDEPNILSSLTRVLRRRDDWEVETFDTVAEALKRIQTMPFEIVISDYRMPEMDGVEFLNEVRKFQPEAIRIVLSGITELQAILDAINEAEIHRYICKPWDDQDLIATIGTALAHREVLVENRRLADRVREQQEELNKRKSALDRLAEEHPALVHVDWADDGSIVVNEEPPAIDE
jgi:response regulator RpfG family c-di-GMP phosphodiesterase